MKWAAPTLIFLIVASGANAQTVFRCGSVYSQTACPNGRMVEATDPRTLAQQAEARRVADDERRLAAEMRRERLAEQAAIKPPTAGSLSGPMASQPASGADRGKKKKLASAGAAPPAFVATDPTHRRRRGQQ